VGRLVTKIEKKLHFTSGCRTVKNFFIFEKECAEKLVLDYVITR